MLTRYGASVRVARVRRTAIASWRIARSCGLPWPSMNAWRHARDYHSLGREGGRWRVPRKCLILGRVTGAEGVL